MENLITQQELAVIFPDGVPMPVMKMIFPEKSEKLTVDDIRYILNAMRSEAALSTGAEPVAEIVSAHGDPEAFGERELVARVDIQKFPYGTKLYTAAASKEPEKYRNPDIFHDAEGRN